MKIVSLLLFIYIVNLYATPQFAKEYNVNCSACHSAVPVLNETGRGFLRDGFRFSVEEKTTLQKVTEDSNTTYIPIAVMLSAQYNNITDSVKAGIKPFMAGTLTKSDSFFVSWGKSKNIYYQKNIEKEKHVIRTGFLSVYTQVSSINRISAGTGASCNDDSCDNIFKTPIQKSSIKGIKGADYSYKNGDTLALISIGRTQDNTNTKKCVDSYDIDYADKTQLSLALKQSFYNYNLGVIYSTIQDSELTNYSLISFLEKDFTQISFHIAYIYRDDILFTYQGFESMLSYRYDSELFFKSFYSYDEDYSYDNQSFMLGFEKNYKNFILSLYAGARKNSDIDESLLKTAVKIYF